MIRPSTVFWAFLCLNLSVTDATSATPRELQWFFHANTGFTRPGVHLSFTMLNLDENGAPEHNAIDKMISYSTYYKDQYTFKSDNRPNHNCQWTNHKTELKIGSKVQQHNTVFVPQNETDLVKFLMRPTELRAGFKPRYIMINDAILRRVPNAVAALGTSIMMELEHTGLSAPLKDIIRKFVTGQYLEAEAAAATSDAEIKEVLIELAREYAE